VVLRLERSPAKHGRLGFVFSWVIQMTLKMVSAASLVLTLRHLRVARRIKKQSVDYVSERKFNSVLAL